MKRFLLLGLTLALTAPAAEFKLGPHNFTLPDGFTIEVAAPSSLVPRPIEADFDELGRLYVTDSSGSNDKVTKQLADKPHRILRLEDTDGDGVFDKSVVFADKMMFPEGAMWLDGSLYVSAPPSIWKLTDTNGDGVADKRVEWFKGQSLGGCANDLHGPYFGPDGWIYWCKGGFEKQTHTLGNGKTFTSRASHIWRARPDGTGLEPIMTGGMDNPVGLAWSPEGELFLSGTFFQHPGGGRRDGLIHVIYGGVYGKDHDVLDGHPRTGELLPIMTHLGPAAPVGLARYESSVFGADYQDNLFCCQFNLHKISRHVLKESGSTYVTTDSNFLVSDNPDFHPTDVFEDADGSLLVIDTGGWYKLCCPTSQLQKPDVLGGIYRIRRKGARTIPNPRGTLAWDKATPAQLTQYLEDARPFVMKRSIAELARRGTNSFSALAGLLKENTVRDWPRYEAARRNAIWALTRIAGPESRLMISETIYKYASASLRLTAHNSSALTRATSVQAAAFGDSRGHQPQLKRAALAALGRMRGHVRPEFASARDDRSVEHALIDALIGRGETGILVEALNSTNIHAHRAALIALDQMPGGNLKPEQVTPLLASTNALLKQTANWIISHHPEWAGALAGFLKERLAAPDVTAAELSNFEPLLARSARQPAIQAILTEAARAEHKPARLAALRAIAAAGYKQTPPDVIESLGIVLRSDDPEVQRAVLDAVLALGDRPRALNSWVHRLAWYSKNPADIRLKAHAAMRGASGGVESGFKFALEQVVATNSATLRHLAANVLTIPPHTDDERLLLTEALGTIGPVEITKVLSAYRGSTNATVGLRLIDALKSVRFLQPAQVRSYLTNFPANVRARAEEFFATLNTDAAKQKARLDELSLNLKSGDVRRGQAIFNSQKAACATCHAIGYLGGNLGPDLTKIGTVRTERDLLEAVVFPSASFVRSYEPMLVVTKSGDEHSGILRKDAPDEVVLATGVGAEARIARADIAEMRPGTVSVMPAGLDEQLTRQELADLLAFLKATKW